MEVHQDGLCKKELNVELKDHLKCAGVVIPQSISHALSALLPSQLKTQVLAIADNKYLVQAMQFVHMAKELTASSLFMQLTKEVGAQLPGEGIALLQNNGGLGMDGKIDPAGVLSGSLTTDLAALTLNEGERLSMKVSGVATELAGVHMQVKLKRI